MIRHGQELPKDKKKIPRFSEMAESYLEWAKENRTREGRVERYVTEFTLRNHWAVSD